MLYDIFVHGIHAKFRIMFTNKANNLISMIKKKMNNLNNILKLHYLRLFHYLFIKLKCVDEF